VRRVVLVAGVLVLIALTVRSCGSRPGGVAPTGSPAADGSPPATAPAATPGDAAPDTLLSHVSCDGLERRLLAAGTSPGALVETFGAPVSRSTSTAPNRHLPGATDTLTALAWDGMEARFRTPPDSEALPVHATVRAPRFLRHPALGPGAPAERVMRVLGEPTRRAPGELVYDCGRGASQPVTFHLDGDGRVERIEISFYVG
jgi:hypothetical protein